MCIRDRQLQQAREAQRGKAGVLQRERLAVGEADADDLGDQVAGVDGQRGGRRLVGGDDARADHPRPGGEALLAQQRGHADDAGQVAFDLGPADERAAPASRHPAHGAEPLQGAERLAQRRPADAEARGELALGAEALAGLQFAGRDQGEELPAGGLHRALISQVAGHVITFLAMATNHGGDRRIARLDHMRPSASRDSGRIWPPSTTMEWPVM